MVANQLAIKWLVPFHTEAVAEILSKANKTIMVENNHSGQFFRYLRSETGITVGASIRKYDGEPFMPHHIADGVRELMGRDSLTQGVSDLIDLSLQRGARDNVSVVLSRMGS